MTFTSSPNVRTLNLFDRAFSGRRPNHRFRRPGSRPPTGPLSRLNPATKSPARFDRQPTKGRTNGRESGLPGLRDIVKPDHRHVPALPGSQFLQGPQGHGVVGREHRGGRPPQIQKPLHRPAAARPVEPPFHFQRRIRGNSRRSKRLPKPPSAVPAVGRVQLPVNEPDAPVSPTNQKANRLPRRGHVVDVQPGTRPGPAVDHHRRQSPPGRGKGRLPFRRHPDQPRQRRARIGINPQIVQGPPKAGQDFNEIRRGKIRIGVGQNPDGPGRHRLGSLYLKKKPRRGVAGIGPESANGSKTVFESRRCSNSCSAPPGSSPDPAPSNEGKYGRS